MSYSSSYRTTPASQEDQKKMHDEYSLAAANAVRKPLHWLVEANWYNNWRAYVGLDSDAPAGAAEPDKITNAAITDEDAGQSRLKPTAQKDKDFVLVPNALWRKLDKWYASTYDCNKYIWDMVYNDAGAVVEERPIKIEEDLVFDLCLCEEGGKASEKSFVWKVDGDKSLKKMIELAVREAEKQWSDDADLKEVLDYDDDTTRVWFSSDGVDDWSMLTRTTFKCAQHLASPDPAVAPRLMVEARKHGFWKRADEAKIGAVKDLQGRLKAAQEQDDEGWRGSLEVGALLDHLDARKDHDKWREADIAAVHGDTLTVRWRGMLEPTVDVQRDSETIAKPYSKCRDWRNQLRSNTKIELLRKHHPEETIKNRGPVYESENQETVLYYEGLKKEWWIAEKKEWAKTKTQARGYLHVEVEERNPLKVGDALLGSDKQWQVYDKSWASDPAVKISAVEGAGVAVCPDYPGLPDTIKMEGHTGAHAEMMGVFHWMAQGEYVRGTVKRIDRKHGEIDVDIKTGTSGKSSSSSYSYSYYEPEKTVQDIPLYDDDICEVGTYTAEARTKSEWMSSVATEDGDDSAQRGIVGLKNLGNTCFMNSMLQCLNAATPFTEYFLRDKHKDELNTKNALGTGGILAEEYGKLLSQVWAGQYKTVGPSDFKDALGRFAPQFAGYQQQDSMELYQFLLDNLHEDVNRVIDKPYTEAVDDEGGCSDEELAALSWERYKMRNDSIVVDKLMGMFRSHLTCPRAECGKEARKFDPYMSVALPVPGVTTTDMSITLYRKGAMGGAGTKFELDVPKGGNYTDLAATLCGKVPGLDIKSLFIFELMQNRVNKTVYSYGQKVPEKLANYRSYDDFIAYDLLGEAAQAGVAEAQELGSPGKADDEDPPAYSWNANQGLVSPEGSGEIILQVRVGFVGNKKGYQLWSMADQRPLVLTVPKDATNGQLRALVAEQVAPYMCTPPPPPPPTDDEAAAADAADAPDDDDREGGAAAMDAADGPTFELYPLDNYGKPSSASSKTTSYSYNFTDQDEFNGLGPDDEVFDATENPGGVAAIFKTARHLNADLLNEVTDHVDTGTGATDDADENHLSRRIAQFAEREQLGEQDTWYCPQCKNHVQAFKKMDIWSIPELLTFHLKRFQYETSTNSYMVSSRVLRDKIDTLIDFPDEFDMRPFVLGPQKDQEEPLIYELYGVSNHIGGMGGGHYTAYAKHDQWYLFNDSRYDPVEQDKIKEIVTSEAYVLFYRLKKDRAEEMEDEGAAAGGGSGGV